MYSELPIACSLSSADLSQRLADMSAVGRAGLLAANIDGVRAALTFRASERERVAAIVVAEAECCAFLNMTLEDGAEAFNLVIEAPDGAEPILQDLVAAFRGTDAGA
jgi:hypothetical protein